MCLLVVDIPGGDGAWQQLLHDASAAARGAGSRGNAQAVQTEAARTRRAEALVHLAELSAASQALVAEPLAAGTQATSKNCVTLSGGRQRHTAPSVKTSGTRIPRSLAPSSSVHLFTACAARGAALPLGRRA